jgi:hypothetical protein
LRLPFLRLLWLAGSRWGYWTPPPYGWLPTPLFQSQRHATTDGQSASPP